MQLFVWVIMKKPRQFFKVFVLAEVITAMQMPLIAKVGTKEMLRLANKVDKK